MDIRQVYVQRRKMKEQATRNLQENKRKSRIRSVPIIALVVANLLVLSLDYRVVEAIYKITDNVALAVFALFTSGAMFILWFDILYHYLLANQVQKNIALAFSGLSLLSAAFFAFLDYGLSAGFGVESILPFEANMLFAGMVILTVANGAGLFAWYVYDDQVQRQSTAEKSKAEDDFEAEKLEDVNRMLAKAETVLSKKTAMESKYGREAVSEMMSLLSGIETALNVDLDGDGHIGKPQNTPRQAVASFASQVGDSLPTVTPKAENGDFTQGQK